jgi:hypothetical protein
MEVRISDCPDIPTSNRGFATFGAEVSVEIALKDRSSETVVVNFPHLHIRFRKSISDRADYVASRYLASDVECRLKTA